MRLTAKVGRMKKLLVSLAVIAGMMAAIVLADTIIRPPVVEWTPVTTYSDGRAIPTNLVVKYNVYRTAGADTNWVLVTTTTNTNYTDTTINLATTYRYRIAAELYGLQAEPSPALTFMTYAPAQISTSPTVK